MGWNTGLIVAEGCTPEDVERAVDIFRLTDEELDLDGAIGELAVATVGNWAVFFDRGGHHVEPGEERPGFLVEMVAELAKQRALLLVLSSVHSTYALEWIVAGKTVRRVTFTDGKPVEPVIGKPLPEEAGIEIPSWGPDEDFLFTVMKRLTGVSADDLASATYRRLIP